MAAAAEELLAGSGWLPEPLRTPGHSFTPGTEAAAATEANRTDPATELAADGPPRAVAAE